MANLEGVTITPWGWWQGRKQDFHEYPQLENVQSVPWLNSWFKENPNVAGMMLSKNGEDWIPFDEDKYKQAYADGKKYVAINPYSNLSPEQQHAVVMNESFRQYLEDIGFVPTFDLSPEQRQARGTVFKDSPYNKYLDSYKKTLMARIFSGDNSFNPTDEQKKMVEIVLQNEEPY